MNPIKACDDRGVDPVHQKAIVAPINPVSGVFRLLGTPYFWEMKHTHNYESDIFCCEVDVVGGVTSNIFSKEFSIQLQNSEKQTTQNTSNKS